MERDYNDIRVWGDSEDKNEILNRIQENKDIYVRHIFAEALEPPLILHLFSGLVNALKLIYDFLKEKRKKKLKVQILLSDGRLISVNSTNFEDLNILIKELTEKTNNIKYKDSQLFA